MGTMMMRRRLIAGAAVGLALSASSIALMSSAARAETFTASTTCTNPYTAAQAGPSSFTFTVPAVIHVGKSVPVQLSFVFANSTGYSITDINSFSMSKATPVALTAGSQGGVANGAEKTVTLAGTWAPKATGKQTISAAGWTFNVVALGITIPVSCVFNSTPPSITRTVTPAPALALGAATVRPKGTVKVSGTNWAPSSSGTVSLCANAAGTGKCSVIGTAKTGASGKLTGSGTIPAGAAAGAHGIKVTVGSDAKSAGIYILGNRAISLSSTTVKVGGSVTVKGSGWDPRAKVKIQPLNKSHKAVGKAVVVTAGATGNFSAVITLRSTSITYVGAAEAARVLTIAGSAIGDRVMVRPLSALLGQGLGGGGDRTDAASTSAPPQVEGSSHLTGAPCLAVRPRTPGRRAGGGKYHTRSDRTRATSVTGRPSSSAWT